MTFTLHLLADIEAATREDALRVLDAFREATQPSTEWRITLSQAPACPTCNPKPTSPTP